MGHGEPTQRHALAGAPHLLDLVRSHGPSSCGCSFRPLPRCYLIQLGSGQLRQMAHQGLDELGASGRPRTNLSLRTTDFESAASTNSATEAPRRILVGAGRGSTAAVRQIALARRGLWPAPGGRPISKAMTPSARLPLLVLAASSVALATAFAAQYWGGLQPCVLCLYQRWPYAVAIALALVALALGGAARGWTVGLAGVAFTVGAGIAMFHVGVEQGWWQGTSECGASFRVDSIESLPAQLMAAP